MRALLFLLLAGCGSEAAAAPDPTLCTVSMYLEEGDYSTTDSAGIDWLHVAGHAPVAMEYPVNGICTEEQP